MGASVHCSQRSRLRRSELLARSHLGANFLVYLALCRWPDMERIRKDLADKSEKLLLKEWLEHRHVHENYNAVTGEGCDSDNSDRFYHWGALLGVVAMAEKGLFPGLGQSL